VADAVIEAGGGCRATSKPPAHHGVPAANAGKFSVSRIYEQFNIAPQDTFDFKYNAIEGAAIIR
jgi:hypothetical protein